MLPVRVLIIYNDPVLPEGHPDRESERAILNTVGFVHGALRRAGFRVSRVGVRDDVGVLFRALVKRRPDVVFNLFEGLPSRGDTEALVAGLLDWIGLPFTGCPFPTLSLAHNKFLTKQLLRGAGLPTPDFFAVHALPVPECPLEWPVIVKPAEQDASVGLDQGSVVTRRKDYEDRVAFLLDQYGPPVLVEQYIAGRELNAAMVETPDLRALPHSEILFLGDEPGHWPIVTYDAKWNSDSREFEQTPPVCPAEVDADLASRLEAISSAAFRLLGCRDYARFDFRVSPAGEPYLLEVNPNPDFDPDSGFARSLNVGGIPHEQFTVDLVYRALARRDTRSVNVAETATD